jgi:uncharacterized membrane protein
LGTGRAFGEHSRTLETGLIPAIIKHLHLFPEHYSSMNPNYFYAIALIGFFGLFALLMLWPTVLVPPAEFPVALVLLISVTPLLLPMRGLLDRNRRSCAWAAYISLIYFIHGSQEAYADTSGQPYALLEVLFSLLLFLGAAFYVRFAKT